MSQRQKVMHVITRMIVGGAQENTLLSCARMDRSRYETVLVTGPQAGSEGSLLDEARAAGVRVVVEPHLVREIAPKDTTALIRLTRLFRRERPDVVHTHSSKAGILGRVAARVANVPHVVHTVHGWSFHDHMRPGIRNAYITAERRTARWSDALVVVTSIDRDKGLAHGIGKPHQYRLIRSGFDPEPFESARDDRAAARRTLGLPARVPVVGSVMRLSDQKDPFTWIRAAAVIARHHPDAHFVLVGDGAHRAAVEAEAQMAGISARLHITGVRRDVAACLSTFDVFLLTSLWEGLPKVVLQAMATGVPVVSTPSDGVREVVRDGESGLLIPPSDPEAAGAAVIRLLDDAAVSARLTTAAARIYPEFSAERMVSQLDELYTALASGPSPRATAR